jgi:hypothetical protein
VHREKDEIEKAKAIHKLTAKYTTSPLVGLNSIQPCPMLGLSDFTHLDRLDDPRAPKWVRCVHDVVRYRGKVCIEKKMKSRS